MKEKIKRYFYYRMHPDAALRYLPMVDLLTVKGWRNDRILEIGSGSYGITPYLKRQVVGVDINFPEPKYEFLTQIKGSGEHLLFDNASFDVVIMSDVLEHVPKSLRPKVINEAIRVARKVVIIGGPFGSEAFALDQQLSNYSKHQSLLEHLRFGLPEVSDILAISHKKLEKIEIVGQYLNLSVRYWLMRLFVARNKLLYYFYLKGLMPLVPILRHMNWTPCYRTLFLLRLKDESWS